MAEQRPANLHAPASETQPTSNMTFSSSGMEMVSPMAMKACCNSSLSSVPPLSKSIWSKQLQMKSTYRCKARALREWVSQGSLRMRQGGGHSPLHFHQLGIRVLFSYAVFQL